VRQTGLHTPFTTRTTLTSGQVTDSKLSAESDQCVGDGDDNTGEENLQAQQGDCGIGSFQLAQAPDSEVAG